MRDHLLGLKLILIISVCSIAGNAKTYYVSSSGGSDAYSGLSPASAWRTIAKVNSTTLQPGDTVLFKCGDTFQGEVSSESGALNNPIVFGAYGTGQKPVISGAIQINSSGWAPYQGSIYVRSNVTLAPMTDGEPPNLFYNGIILQSARYPDTGYLTAQSVIGGNPGSHCCEFANSCIDPALSQKFFLPGDLQNGHISAYDPYGISTRRIVKYNPANGEVKFDTLRGASFMTEHMYFLSCTLAFLDSPGEWYYDDAAKKLYVWFPNGSSPASNDTLLCSNYQFGINLWQVDNIKISDLEFRYQKIAGLFFVRSDHVTVENNIFYGSKNGIFIWGTDGPPEILVRNVTVRNNVFLNILREGINSRNLDQCIISNNIFRDIGLNNGLGQSGKPDQWGDYGYYAYGLAIQATGINSQISYNNILRTGRQAIASGGPNVSTKCNIIDSSCLGYNDCGGLMPLSDGVVENNIIKNCTGPFEIHKYMGARGIYPDFRSRDTIRNNTIIHTTIGIGLTNSKNEVVSGNTVYGSSFVQFRMNKKTAQPLNNFVRKNIFFGLDETAYS